MAGLPLPRRAGRVGGEGLDGFGLADVDVDGEAGGGAGEGFGVEGDADEGEAGGAMKAWTASASPWAWLLKEMQSRLLIGDPCG